MARGRLNARTRIHEEVISLSGNAENGNGENDFGANDWLVDEMYAQFKANPDSVDKVW
ncbi:MAG: 2-oxoglutarate dehydrogenase E1 subunit family protein, partial [Rhodoluna sp.]